MQNHQKKINMPILSYQVEQTGSIALRKKNSKHLAQCAPHHMKIKLRTSVFQTLNAEELPTIFCFSSSIPLHEQYKNFSHLLRTKNCDF